MRTSLALLATLPLLLPPGTCACQLAPRPAAPPAPAVQGTTARCACCAHGKRTDAERPVPDRSPVRLQPADIPHCFCATTADFNKPADAPVQSDDVAPATVAVRPPQVTPTARESAPNPATVTNSHTPLYLSHCALLI